MQKLNILSIIITIFLLVSFTGCSSESSLDASDSYVPLKIAVLNGNTGIGGIKLMEQTEKYEVSVYQSPDEITGKIITGEADAAAVPSNLAAVLYNRTEGQVVVLCPIAFGVLYIVQNVDDESQVVSSISDLQGKTLLAGGKGSTAEYILDKLLRSSGLSLESDINIEWLSNHSDVNAALLARPGSIAMIPEPFVSIAGSKSENIRTVLDLNEEWRLATGSELTMSALIARKSVVQDRSHDIEAFLSDYKNSIDFINESPDAAALVSEKGFLPNAEIAAKAIPGCNLVFFEDRQEGHLLLRAFYEILFEIEPRSIGGSLPDADFYY